MEMEHRCVTPQQRLEPDMKPDCSNKKSVASRKELSTPVNPSVLQDPPRSTNDYDIDFLGSTSVGIAMPGQTLL